MEKIIAAYCHTGTSLYSTLEEAFGAQVEKIDRRKYVDENKAVEELKNYKIVICHCDSEAFEHLIDISKSGDIRIHVSSTGLKSELESNKTIKNGVYRFNVCTKIEELNAKIIKEIVNAFKQEDKLKKIINGNVPASLKKHLLGYHVSTRLISLNIICQIFLATHSPQEKNGTTISEILSGLGWWDFCGQQSESDLLNKVKSKSKLTEMADWYAPLRKGYTIDNVLSEFNDEIDAVPDKIKSSISINTLRENMHSLLSSIYNEVDLNLEYHLNLIADIYSELKRLV